MGFLHKPQSVWLRRALFQVHLWVGIATGLYVFVVCVTGAALVFRIDMQRALFPELFTPSSSAPPADASTILESVRDTFPNDRVSGIDAPTTTRPTYLAYVMRGNTFLTLLFDPNTGRLLGELPDESALRLLQDLHFDLLGGRTGRTINGIGAVCLAAMALTGFVIWWPGIATWRRALTIDIRRSWRRINFDLHGAAGIWTGALVLMWAVTGIYFVWPQPFRSFVNTVSPITVTRPPTSRAVASAAKASWRTLVEKAETLAPGQHVARVVVPSSDTAAFLVMFTAVQPTPAGSPRLTSVYLDQYSGDVLQEAAVSRRTLGDVVMAWVAPLHVGSFGGNGIRAAWLVLGLTPPLLFVTGFIMWWARVVQPRRRMANVKAVAAIALTVLATAQLVDAQYAWTLTPRVPPPRVPVEAPMTTERVELGRHLFYDTRLSVDGTQSCATCHLQEKAFTPTPAVAQQLRGMQPDAAVSRLMAFAWQAPVPDFSAPSTVAWQNPALRAKGMDAARFEELRLQQQRAAGLQIDMLRQLWLAEMISSRRAVSSRSPPHRVRRSSTRRTAARADGREATRGSRRRIATRARSAGQLMFSSLRANLPVLHGRSV